MAKNSQEIATVDAHTGEFVEAIEEVRQAGAVDTAIQELVQGFVPLYSSLSGDDFESKKAVAKHLSASKPLDELDGVLNLKHFIVLKVELNNVQTGEMDEAPRVILIDDNDNSYHATSFGVLKALTNIVGIVGQPETWTEPIGVILKKEKTRAGYNVSTLAIA